MEDTKGFERFLHLYLASATLDEQQQVRKPRARSITFLVLTPCSLYCWKLGIAIDEAIAAVDALLLQTRSSALIHPDRCDTTTSVSEQSLGIIPQPFGTTTDVKVEAQQNLSQSQPASASTSDEVLVIDPMENGVTTATSRLSPDCSAQRIGGDPPLPYPEHQLLAGCMGTVAWTSSPLDTRPSHPMTAIQLALVNGRAADGAQVKGDQRKSDRLPPTLSEPRGQAKEPLSHTAEDISITSAIPDSPIQRHLQVGGGKSPPHAPLSLAASSADLGPDRCGHQGPIMSPVSSRLLMKREESVESIIDSSQDVGDGSPLEYPPQSSSLSMPQTWTTKAKHGTSW